MTKFFKRAKSSAKASASFSLSSTGTTVREAHVSYGETKSWRAWEAIGLG